MPSTVETAPTAQASATPAKGFTDLEDEVSIDRLPVRGELPWLTGSLLRTGPAKWTWGEQEMRHWFDGAAMLHRFAFEDGEVSYANRFLEGRAYQAAREQGEIAYSEFATDPCRSLFKRVSMMFNPKGGISDNCNVNLVKLGERFVAMTETPIPVQFDLETLEAAGVAYEAPGMLTTAHPHLDRSSGGMLNYAAKLGPRNEYRFFHLAPDAEEPEVIASARVDKPAYMHSFGLTERWLILAEFPFVVNPLGSPSRAGPTSRTTSGCRSAAPASPCSTAGPERPGGRSRPTPASASITSTPTRRTGGWWRTSAPSRTPRSSRTSTWTTCARASPSPSPGSSASRSRPRTAPSRSGDWPRRRSSCRGSTTGAVTSGLTATSGASARTRPTGSIGSSRSTSPRRGNPLAGGRLLSGRARVRGRAERRG